MQQDLYNINQYDVRNLQTNNGWVFVGLIYAFIAIGIFLFPAAIALIDGQWKDLMYYMIPFGWVVAAIAGWIRGLIIDISTPLAEFTSKFLSKINWVGFAHLLLVIVVGILGLIISSIIDAFNGSFGRLMGVGVAAALIFLIGLCNNIKRKNNKFRKE